MVLFDSYNFRKKEENIAKLITDGLASVEKVQRDNRLYVSDSALCELRGVLSASFNGHKERDGLFKFWVSSGINTENQVLDGLNGSGRLLFSDYRLPDIGINMGGRVDGIILFEDRVWILEVKEKGFLPNKPIPSHESQAMVYAAVLGLPAMILYVDRKISGFPSGLLCKKIVLDTSYENRYKYLERAVRVHLYLEGKLIPPKPDHMKKSWCKSSNCDFYDMCWLGEKKETRYGFHNAHPQQIKIIERESQRFTSELLSPEIAKNRTTGILKFILTNGRESGKILLKDDWSRFYL